MLLLRAVLALALALALARAPLARAVEDKISHVNVLLPWRRRVAAPANAEAAAGGASAAICRRFDSS